MFPSTAATATAAASEDEHRSVHHRIPPPVPAKHSRWDKDLLEAHDSLPPGQGTSQTPAPRGAVATLSDYPKLVDTVAAACGGGSITRLVEEDDEGSVEYKWKLTNVTKTRFNHLVTQMKFRVTEGGGECLYELGVEDDGFPRGLPPDELSESLTTIRRMADSLGFSTEVVVERTVCEQPVPLRCAEVRVRRFVTSVPMVRVAMLGDSGTGKSTIVGVLAEGLLDDGCGSARQCVFNHKHELRSGRTTSVAERLLGFDHAGRLVNYGEAAVQAMAAMNPLGDIPSSNMRREGYTAEAAALGSAPSEGFALERIECCDDAVAAHSKVCALLLDLPGHIKYQTTAMWGLCALKAHIALLTFDVTSLGSSQDAGQQPQSLATLKAYMQRCATMSLPFALLLTKTDVSGLSPMAVPRVLTFVTSVVRELFGGRKEVKWEAGSSQQAPAAGGGMGSAQNSSHSVCGGGMDFLGSESLGNQAVVGGSTGMSRSSSSSDFFIESAGQSPVRDNEHRELPTVATAAMPPPRTASRSEGHYFDRHIPVLSVSAVTGQGISALKQLIFRSGMLLVSAAPPEATAGSASISGDSVAVPEHEPAARLAVSSIQYVQGAGYVATGLVEYGRIAVGDLVYAGPRGDGTFVRVAHRITSIHVQRSHAQAVSAPDEGAFAIGHEPLWDGFDPATRKGVVIWKPPGDSGGDPTVATHVPPRAGRAIDVKCLLSTALVPIDAANHVNSATPPPRGAPGSTFPITPVSGSTSAQFPSVSRFKKRRGGAAGRGSTPNSAAASLSLPHSSVPAQLLSSIQKALDIRKGTELLFYSGVSRQWCKVEGMSAILPQGLPGAPGGPPAASGGQPSSLARGGGSPTMMSPGNHAAAPAITVMLRLRFLRHCEAVEPGTTAYLELHHNSLATVSNGMVPPIHRVEVVRVVA